MMNVMSVNLTAKEFSAGVGYTPFESMVVTQQQIEDKTLFLADSLMKEVMRGSEKQQHRNIKKLKKILKTSLAALGTGAGMTSRAFAATAATGVAMDPITPAIVMKWGLTIALISVSAGIALSMTMLSVAGIYRMFRKRKEATEWTSDIVKGLVQVLIAVPTVYVLYFLAQMLFSHLAVLKAIF